MSDQELVSFNAQQFARLDLLLSIIGNALWAINDQLKPIDNAINKQATEITKWQSLQLDEIKSGFTLVAEAIDNIQPLPQPQPKPTGVIMARFKIAADNPDFTVELTGSGFTDSEGNPTGAGDIDLSVESSNVAVLETSNPTQTLSEDGQSVALSFNVHVGTSSPDMAALAYKATNRDTSAVVAAGSDEFLVNAGEASVGTVTSSVPLTPEPEA